MPIRIKLFFIIFFTSFTPLVFIVIMIPHLLGNIFTIEGAPLLVILFVMVVLITAVSIFFSIQFSLPLTELHEITRKVQIGDFSQRANIRQHDEIGELAAVFNAMLDSLQNQQSRMQNIINQKTKELELKVLNLEETKKAMLNVMEDLEQTRIILQVEKAKDEAMLASIGEGLIAVDGKRKILLVNNAAQEMLQWKADEVIGQELTSLPLADMDGNILPADKRPTIKALTKNEQVQGNYIFIRKDKTSLPISITVTPIILKGRTIGAIDTFHDITREREVDKAKSEFVSIASHQLRTPLGIIKWYLEVLEEDSHYKKLPKTTQGYITEIYKNNERVLSLMRELLSVSRIDQGQIKNVPKPVDLIQIVNRIVERMQVLATKKKVALSLNIPDQKIPTINIDIIRFQEVIENLIVNAIEYTKASGSVRVNIEKQGNTLIIMIKDTGIGISTKDQKRLFTRFFRSEKAIGFNPEGSGLGLYVAKAYVEAWGGKISTTSVEGKGTTFTISLPIIKA